jgi:uncharacterized protein (TIGR00369 family)
MNEKPVRASITQVADLMFPSDSNAQGNVFGGTVLKMIDKAAAVCAIRHAEKPCVTIAMDRVEFRVPIRVGDYVTAEAQVNHVGRTSIEIGVEVYAEDLSRGERRHTNSCLVTFVALGPDGKPSVVRPLRLETPEEKRRWEEAEERRKQRTRRK